MKDNQASYPQLRFKGFTDPWEERKLSDISNVTKLAGFEFTKYVRYQESGKIIALRGLNVKNGKLVLDEVKYIDDSDFSKLNRSKLYKNDILLTYVGTVGELAIVPENDKYYLAPNVARIRLQDHVNSIFVCQMMNDLNFYNRIISPLIATSSQPALSMENVRKFQLLMPDYQEQEKIGSFFKQLDDTIALHQRKLAKLKELKQGYLQKLFPRNGSKFPQLRFAGFADAWKQRKLGTIYDFGKGKGLPLDSFIYSSNNPAIAYGHLYTKYSEVISEVFWSSNDNGVLSKDNDLLFPGSSTVPNGTAQANAITLNNVKLGGDIIIGRPKEGVGVLSTFMSYQVNSQRQKLFPITVGTTITHMYGKDISKLNFFITDYSEQEKIASFFKQLDDTIALHQRKLEKLQELKKGYLQKMFC